MKIHKVTNEIEDLCIWVKEIKGITKIDLEDLIDYLPEYKEWLIEISKDVKS